MDEKKVDAFVKGLSREELMLVTLRGELYGGMWDRMLKDLKDRLEGRPHIVKLVDRIEEDIERIKKLRAFEVDNGVNLKDFVG